MAGKQDFDKVTIGRSEELEFVDLSLSGVPAKTDTGAYRSSVHASDIRLDESTGILSFTLLGGHPLCGAMHAQIETKEFRTVWIESSTGHGEHRYEVKFRVKIGGRTFTTSFSLADRSKRTYPVLLGRKLLNGRFLVDPEASSINRAELKKSLGVEFPTDEEGEYENSDSI